MTLGQKQRKFTRMIADLILFAYNQGYELTFGDAYRDPQVHGAVGQKKSYSSANSLHKERLAVDFNLFKGGQFLTRTEDHQPLGEYWESIGGTWGGRFNDGNHYSLEHGGRK
ncbi:M15 family metallopeptidase [Halopseudomonas bauzanensis]|uniref:M15 family metallopeptidase n=1 Tax=Halopseudomonas bauzanensis TaxID=653930 RepID=UPI0025539FEA|nr:M15 family metallopeptidase [Halopseudomonas bauzanensis]